jgi:hypothetical protein
VQPRSGRRAARTVRPLHIDIRSADGVCAASPEPPERCKRGPRTTPMASPVTAESRCQCSLLRRSTHENLDRAATRPARSRQRNRRAHLLTDRGRKPSLPDDHATATTTLTCVSAKSASGACSCDALSSPESARSRLNQRPCSPTASDQCAPNATSLIRRSADTAIASCQVPSKRSMPLP